MLLTVSFEARTHCDCKPLSHEDEAFSDVNTMLMRDTVS